MKRCPECRRDYLDDTLSFCLADGAELVYGVTDDEPSTAILSEPGAVATGSPAGESPTRAQIHTTDRTSIYAREPEAEPRGKIEDSTERRSLSAHRAAEPRRAFANRAAKPLAALIVLILILVAGFFGYKFFSAASSKQIESIAVMPFVNDSGDPDAEYLSDGMTETLMSSLSELPNLSVKARSSVFRYKGKETDTRTIGKELNVQAVLNGRIAKRGDQLSLSLELVDTQTENLLWSRRYDRKQTDLISLQTEIARDVSQKLKTKLTGADEQRVAKSYTENAEAYQLFVKGRFYWNRRTVPDLQKAIGYFDQAIAIDPNYALAYAGLSNAYANLAQNFGTPPDTFTKARAAALKAIALDDDLAEAHAALGFVLENDYDFAKVEHEYKRSIALNPNYATAHQWYATLLSALSRYEEALVESRRALELDPFSLIINKNLGNCLYYARRYDESIEQLRRTIELNPNFPHAHSDLSDVYHKTGNYAASVEEFAKFHELIGEQKEASLARETYARDGWQGFLRLMTSGAQPIKIWPTESAFYFVASGDKATAISKLEGSYDAAQLIWLNVEPLYDPLRDEPRFRELLKKVGFPN